MEYDSRRRSRIVIDRAGPKRGYFAFCDFDRALAMTSQFERREIRMMAQLKLAQGVLDEPPKKPLFANDEH
jgi:hypothetical protein